MLFDEIKLVRWPMAIVIVSAICCTTIYNCVDNSMSYYEKVAYQDYLEAYQQYLDTCLQLREVPEPPGKRKFFLPEAPSENR